MTFHETGLIYFVFWTFSGSLYLSSCTWKLGTSSCFSFVAIEKEIWEPCGQETEKLNTFLIQNSPDESWCSAWLRRSEKSWLWPWQLTRTMNVTYLGKKKTWSKLPGNLSFQRGTNGKAFFLYWSFPAIQPWPIMINHILLLEGT